MGAVGTSPVNALAESFNATLKRELLQSAHAWPDEATCRREVFGWVNGYKHPPSPLLLRTTGPHRLRTAAHRYAAARWLIDHPVSIIRG